jgi:hypothetical protein
MKEEAGRRGKRRGRRRSSPRCLGWLRHSASRVLVRNNGYDTTTRDLYNKTRPHRSVFDVLYKINSLNIEIEHWIIF